MDAARWCFVLICHTLLTERGGQNESGKKQRKPKKKCLSIAKSAHGERRLHRWDPALRGSLFLPSGSGSCTAAALCQAGCTPASTDATPRRSPNLATIKVHLSWFLHKQLLLYVCT